MIVLDRDGLLIQDDVPSKRRNTTMDVVRDLVVPFDVIERIRDLFLTVLGRRVVNCGSSRK
jgi:hypothetical protein